MKSLPLTMTIDEVKEITGFTLNQCYQLMKVKSVPAKKVGKEWKILRSRFPEWFEKYMEGTDD